jgi:MHS family shikimate/dehydroshikimate transporter-like MFS transporter
VWFGGSAFVAAFAFPMFWLVESENIVLIAVALVLQLAGALAAMAAAQASLFPELFETRHRFSGVVLARESSAALIAGPAPFVGAALLQYADGASWPIALLFVALGATSFIAILFAPETRHVDLTRAIA